MRSRSEIRLGLRAAFEARGHATWREVLPAVGVNPSAPSEALLVRRTVENMARAGELVRVGSAKTAGSPTWLALYELCERKAPEPEPAPTPEPVARLADAMRFFVVKGGR